MRRKSASEQFALPKGQLWADFSRKTRQLIYLSKLTQRKLENELSSYLFSSPFEQRSYCAKKWNQICSFMIRCTLADFSFFYRWCQAKLDQLTWLVASYTQRTTLTTPRHDEKHPEVEFMRFQPTTSFLARKKEKTVVAKMGGCTHLKSWNPISLWSLRNVFWNKLKCSTPISIWLPFFICSNCLFCSVFRAAFLQWFNLSDFWRLRD